MRKAAKNRKPVKGGMTGSLLDVKVTSLAQCWEG
jgi:hypothetical protein